MRTLIALGVLGIQTTFAGRAFGLRSPLFIGSELLLLLCILFVSRVVLPMLDRHDRGARGEEHVGGLLDGLLGEGWQVIHDASFGRGDVDHIVIGPPGAFTVETKSHPGPIAVGRVHGALLRQARAQSELLEAAVEMPVEPLLVYSRAWVDRPLARRKGVRVLPARMLLRYLRERERRMSAQEIESAGRALLLALREQEAQDAQLAQDAQEAGAAGCAGRPRAQTGSAAPISRAPTGPGGSVMGRARNRRSRNRTPHA
jgi:Nuclease-related domain